MGQERITNMVRERGDWCISRQRIWGVPIPIFYCKDCKKELINDDTIKAVAKLFAEKGSDAWYEYDAKDILPKVRNVNADAKNLPRKRTSWTYGSIPVPAMLPFLKQRKA